MNMLNLPTLLQAGLAHGLIAVAAPQSIQQAPPVLHAQLLGANLYVLLMMSVLLVALLAVAWMACRMLQRAREFESINLRLQGELAAREDFAEQLQQLNAQLEQRTAEVQRLSLAVEHTPASVVLTGRNARIDYVNPSFVAQTGYTAAEVIGKNPRILQSGLHSPEYYAQMWRTLTNGEVWRGEMCNRDKHGNLYWEDTSIAPIRNHGGRIHSYVAVKIDITARKLAEREKQEAEQQFRSLVGNLPATVYRLSCDSDYTIEFISDAVETLCGYPAADFVNNSVRSFFSVIHPDDVQMVNAETRRAARAQKPFELRFRLLHRDGTVREVMERGRAIYDEDGKPRFIDGVITDITEQAVREQALAESEARCRTLFESTSDAIMILDEIAYRDGNQAALDLFDFDGTQTLCQNHPVDVSPATQPCGTSSRLLAQQHYDTAIRDGRCRFEWVHQRRDGERFEADVLYSAMVLDGRTVVQCSVRDITLRKKAQQNLQAAKAAAEEATRAKSQFLASMSHELRTPLNGVIGMMELLAGTELTDQQRQLADACRNSGESLLYLINDILDFSKIEAGKLELELHDFELEKLISETLQTLHWRATEKGLQMPSQVDPMPGLIVSGDSNRLRQVLVNLLGNAIKFTPTGEVAIGTQIVDRQPDRVAVRFSISDTGVGIADDKLAKLFQPFSQVDASTTRNYGGTGLGLTISQRLVELMGGTIEVESQVGVGSRFWFQVDFPVVRQAADDGSPPPSDSEDVPAAPVCIPTTAHVLLAEDNNINQMYMTELFKQLGVRCDLADTGRQACDAVQQHRYDLVLMDCQMPDMDGFEATQRIRQWETAGELAGHLPIIALTAMAVKGDRQRCLDAGMDEYLSKPVQREQIVDIFQQFLQPADPVDAESLLQRCFHDIDFACSLLDELLDSGDERVQKIRRHAQRREAAATAAAAHALKGAAGILCADSVQQLAGEIEQAGRQENIDDIDDTLNRLQSEMQRCLDFVPRLREQLQTMVKDV